MVNTGDTAFILVSTALVMLMTPGLALFYGGMVRGKNVLGTLMQCFVCLALISFQWALVGYSLAFSQGSPWLGGLDWALLSGVGLEPNPDYAPTIPHQAFMLYQMMFAVITPALIAGAFAERMKFKAFLIFVFVWATVVYDPLAHWVWGTGGWLREMGVLDFAGGVVVHISSGASALACALIMGRRTGYDETPFIPHDLPMTVLGTGLLWFGWFGFNGGSALASGGLSTSAFTATHMAAAMGALGWMAAEWFHQGKPTTLGAASGAVAGLATITPASGFVAPLPAAFIGVVAGPLCYMGVSAKWRLRYDDSLDVVGVHGLGSTWGMLAAGLFASTMVNQAGANGLLFGNPRQLYIQGMGVLIAWLYSFVMTAVIIKVIDAVIGLRVSPEEELSGLDQTQHGEAAYSSEGI